MPNLQEVLDTQKQLEVTLGSRMAHFEKMLQPSSGSLSEPNFEFITREFYEFKMFALDVFRLLRSQIETLLSQVDEIDTHKRRNALLLHGLPEKENENCTAVVINIIHSNMSLKNNEIELCGTVDAQKVY
ncbi:Uncharacterized protein OBRU01_13965 [Operophtera brumata]|uniref:Uncharacterized protein n=1 Tax=Operophtera brumata TaxID=104452 RepID=A0A0L7KUU4_OPEBR|nr:Uncharacterized protein OBRU01_13965 [Operophtera brumata]